VNALRTPGRHSIGDNLVLAITASGSRSWVARVRDATGRRRDIGLGPFADVSLASAREKAKALRIAGREGEPVLSRAERRKLERRVPTFREAAKLVHAERLAVWKNEKHGDQWLATLEAHVFPKLGDVPVDQIGVPQVIDVLSPIWQRLPETARRVRQRIRAVIDWAHAREYRATQISAGTLAAGLGQQREKAGRFAALPYSETPQLITSVRKTESFGRLALEFLILTAARSGEVRGATWAEIDLERGLWTVPAERMKANREHVVPLSDRALAIVRRAAKLHIAGSDIVFPGASGNTPMSDVALAKALRVAGVASDRGTVHGMRSAFRDWVSEETNFPGDVAEAALAHAISNKVEAAYRRGNLLAKRREMMTAWARYCEGDAASVVRMVVAG
jgi:integrase